MDAYFLKEHDFKKFVENMMAKVPVIAPVAKQTRFVFSELKTANDLRLDYDVTILPPKKVFWPPAQDLVKFTGRSYEGCIQPREQVLFGVHFYDIKGIDQTDIAFRDGNPDRNYLAQREATTIVGSNIQNVSKRGFWGSVGTNVPPRGHDAFLTKINGGYVYEVLTPKGQKLSGYGTFEKASPKQLEEAKKVNDDVMSKCAEKLNYSAEAIAKKVRESFKKDELWNKMAEDCFSCGSCNTTCPTCYCFDVLDHVNVDQVTGRRTRYWDSCLTEDFAKISLGGGAHENFRETRGSRFRHRFMRKFTYLNGKFGGPACVGCGRCSTACTSDIADPVETVKTIMES